MNRKEAMEFVHSEKLAGRTYQEVADALNAVGFKTNSGNDWIPASVHKAYQLWRKNGGQVYDPKAPRKNRKVEEIWQAVENSPADIATRSKEAAAAVAVDLADRERYFANGPGSYDIESRRRIADLYASCGVIV